jgi:hypothetical protein
MENKVYKVKVLETLKGLQSGDSVEFITAGECREVTIESLRNAVYKTGREMRVTSIDNGLRAIVTAL